MVKPLLWLSITLGIDKVNHQGSTVLAIGCQTVHGTIIHCTPIIGIVSLSHDS